MTHLVRMTQYFLIVRNGPKVTLRLPLELKTQAPPDLALAIHGAMEQAASIVRARDASHCDEPEQRIEIHDHRGKILFGMPWQGHRIQHTGSLTWLC
jgi:hypothetical protein